MSNAQYQPGVCNIGGAEVARRKQVALIGAILFIAFSLLALLRDFSYLQGAIAFLPAMVFAIGFIQSRKKFCLAYGFMGTFNFQNLGTLSKVTDKDALRADQRTALSIIFQGLVLALAMTLALIALLSL